MHTCLTGLPGIIIVHTCLTGLPGGIFPLSPLTNNPEGATLVGVVNPGIDTRPDIGVTREFVLCITSGGGFPVVIEICLSSGIVGEKDGTCLIVGSTPPRPSGTPDNSPAREGMRGLIIMYIVQCSDCTVYKCLVSV